MLYLESARRATRKFGTEDMHPPSGAVDWDANLESLPFFWIAADFSRASAEATAKTSHPPGFLRSDLGCRKVDGKAARLGPLDRFLSVPVTEVSPRPRAQQGRARVTPDTNISPPRTGRAMIAQGKAQRSPGAGHGSPREPRRGRADLRHSAWSAACQACAGCGRRPTQPAGLGYHSAPLAGRRSIGVLAWGCESNEEHPPHRELKRTVIIGAKRP